ncbi:SDR family oxidoreductase [Mesorhizobium sp. M0118]
MAKRLASEGAFVVATDMNGDAAGTVVAEIEASGSQATAIVSDIANGEPCRELIAKVIEQKGRVDILANNAGINRRGNIEAVSEDDWRLSFAVNIDAMFHLCKAVIPHMIGAGGGTIVNMASQWGLYPAPNHIAYNVTKAAVASFTQNLGRDYAPHKIRVNAVCPGEITRPCWKRVSGAPAGRSPIWTNSFPSAVLGNRKKWRRS